MLLAIKSIKHAVVSHKIKSYNDQGLDSPNIPRFVFVGPMHCSCLSCLLWSLCISENDHVGGRQNDTGSVYHSGVQIFAKYLCLGGVVETECQSHELKLLVFVWWQYCEL